MSFAGSSHGNTFGLLNAIDREQQTFERQYTNRGEQKLEHTDSSKKSIIDRQVMKVKSSPGLAK
jgi:hypothetical protein